MDDLISRQAAIDALKEHRALYCDNTPDTFSKLSYAEKSRVDELDTAIATVVNLPSAEPERKKGTWVERDARLHYCSECGWALMDDEDGNPPYMGIDYHRENPERWMCCPGWNGWLMNYCPNCGADMRGGEE